jgi:hypothetical protein
VVLISSGEASRPRRLAWRTFMPELYCYSPSTVITVITAISVIIVIEDYFTADGIAR